LRFALEKRGRANFHVQPEFEQVGDDVVIGSTQWLNEDGGRGERFQVITFRGGRIVDLQGCASRREAERFARRVASRA